VKSCASRRRSFEPIKPLHDFREPLVRIGWIASDDKRTAFLIASKSRAAR